MTALATAPTAIKTTKAPRPSFVLMGEGGIPMWDNYKAKNLGTVKVVTDDLDIAVGLLVRDNEKTVVVATLTPTRHSIETQETGRRYRCQVFQIAKSRINEFATLS